MWILFGIIGLILLSVSFAVGHKYKLDLVKMTTLPAVIEENHKKVMEGGTVRYYPVLKFSYDGKEQLLQYGFGTKKPRYSVGQKVDILYDGSNGIFYIAGDTIESRFFWGWSITGFLFLIGAVLWIAFFGW